MEKQTTLETLAEMLRDINNFNAEDWYDGVTKDGLKARYDCYKKIA